MLNSLSKISLLVGFASIFVLSGCEQPSQQINNTSSETNQNKSSMQTSTTNKPSGNMKSNSGRISINSKIENQPQNSQSSDSSSSQSSKTISPKEIRDIFNNSQNHIAAESNLDSALSNRQITIKSFKISIVERMSIPDKDVAYSILDEGSSSDYGLPFITILFRESQKQAVLSLQRGSTINVKCEYIGYAAGKVIFGFESFD